MAHSLQQLQQIIDQALEEENFSGQPQELYEPIQYLMQLGGKRIRPTLTLAAYQLFASDLSKAIKPAIGLEVFHNFTLIHDDIMDKAAIRRGKPTVHEKYSANTAILSGDAMFILANQLMMKAPGKHLTSVLDIFNKTALEICEGQQYDMIFESSTSVSIDDYLKMITLKTAVLLGSCLQIGCLLADAPEQACKTIYQFGKNLGIAFQLQDDLLDSFGNGDQVGKKIGGDILQNKKTFLLVKCLEISKSHPDIHEKLHGWITDNSQPQNKIKAVLEIYNSFNIKALTQQAMAGYYALALDAFNSLDVSEDRKKPLQEITALLEKRAY